MGGSAVGTGVGAGSAVGTGVGAGSAVGTGVGAGSALEQAPTTRRARLRERAKAINLTLFITHLKWVLKLWSIPENPLSSQ